MLTVQNVTYRHAPEVTLHYPEVQLQAGDQLVLSGPSGCGKTTLLHLISGLLVPTAGQIEESGVRVSGLSERARDAYRAGRVGYLFQDFYLMPGYSAQEQVALGLGLAGVRGAPGLKRARELLAQLGLAGRLHHRPGQLSTGERQRVALARALAHRPALLLADEPTAHLDSERGAQVLALLQQSARELGATLITASHDPAVIRAFGHRLALGPSALPEQGAA
jgi:putative ABC transport system ATP-binding protein